MIEGLGWFVGFWVLLVIAVYYTIIKTFRKAHEKCMVCGHRIGRKNVVYDQVRDDYYHFECWVRFARAKILQV